MNPFYVIGRVMCNIVEPALKSWNGYDQSVPVSKITFLQEFKKMAKLVARNLKEQPVIVAHSKSCGNKSS
ncbi:hypothetical protein V6N11_080841 [Hibiscus sabdariffa]|uniref:Uncharacterized protein n=1 Tax=Hibiscus sabdariffa TaxID=183260 RepID=A0ABR2QIK6_9ROSI